jgi:hypothetical protein
MTDETTTREPEAAPAGESSGWTAEEPDGKGTGREWLAQLQTMMENLANQAVPVIKEVGAKAAELAAMAGEKAGPAAQRAAEFTADAGHKIAERSRDLAVELRRERGEEGDALGGDAAPEVASEEEATPAS